jgi:hypothetical protein
VIKKSGLALLVALSASFLTFENSGVFASVNSAIYQGYINGGNRYKNYKDISISWSSYTKRYYPVINPKNSKPFNCELYQDRHIFVYGQPSDISGNAFRSVDKGYFLSSGVIGEYRYLGYDKDGSKVENPNFPKDISNDWIYEPYKRQEIMKQYPKDFLKEYENNVVKRLLNAQIASEVSNFKNANGINLKDVLQSKTNDLNSILKYSIIRSSKSSNLIYLDLYKQLDSGIFEKETFFGDITNKRFPSLTIRLTSDKNDYKIESNENSVKVKITLEGKITDNNKNITDVDKLVMWTRDEIQNYGFSLKGDNINVENSIPTTIKKEDNSITVSRDYVLTFYRNNLNEGNNQISYIGKCKIHYPYSKEIEVTSNNLILNIDFKTQK